MRTIGLFAALTLIHCAGVGPSVPPASRPSSDPYAEALEGADKREGLLTLYVKPAAGRVLLAIPPSATSPAPDASAAKASGVVGEFIYIEGLATGLGSNPVGLDRGQLGDTRLVTLRVLADRLLIEEQNLAFRARSNDAAEVAAARESFATSVLWAGPIIARSSNGEALVDITSFVVRDAHGVVPRLKHTGQGVYSLSTDKSAIDPAAILAFPDNVALSALLTYEAREGGPEVSATAPTGTSFSLTQYHTFVRLPDAGYRPRVFHPRSGAYPLTFTDYAAGLDETHREQYIERHRLNAGEPLVYYVDPAIPEPVQSAVIEGASWWTDAFAAAGFPDTFKVELLPPDVHPLDVRYNVIQWVHRSTRGWSYGFGAVDPRTGEIIKGQVNLGSLRVRQDRRIFEGLLGTKNTGSGRPDDPVQLALARIRQLAAHEVGHTLGFAHNFAASANDRASVMDYPAPLVTVKGDGLDVSSAYAVGIGEWDKLAVRYAYGEYEDEAAGLKAVIDEASERGFRFISDADARPAGAAHPFANLWDNGSDPVAALESVLAVRSYAIAHFGPDNVASDVPLAALEEVFAPIYFYHRYQVEAATKTLGGIEYAYAVPEDTAHVTATPVDAVAQRRALQVLLRAIEPTALDIPETVLRRLVPRAYGLERSREQFDSRTRPAFDALGAARTGADLVVAGLFQPERAARLVDQHRRDRRFLSFSDVVTKTMRQAFRPVRSERHRAIQREVQSVVVDRLIHLAANPSAPGSVRADAEAALRQLRGRLRSSAAQDAHLRAKIGRFLDRSSAAPPPTDVPSIPPGSPIGSLSGCGH